MELKQFLEEGLIPYLSELNGETNRAFVRSLQTLGPNSNLRRLLSVVDGRFGIKCPELHDMVFVAEEARVINHHFTGRGYGFHKSLTEAIVEGERKNKSEDYSTEELVSLVKKFAENLRDQTY